jgi:uncharacterized membrane protein
MGETRQLLALVVLALVIGAIAVLIAMAIPSALEGDLVISQYQAELQPDGHFSETYTYEVKAGGEYRMLYRYWQDPMTIGNLTTPFIQLLGMDAPPGTIGYAKDNAGHVTIFSGDGTAATGFIQSMAELNEVGIYNPGYFPTGTYTVRYSYLLHVPVEYDSSNAHLNLRLVDKHIPYRSLEIRVPAALATSVYPHPPSLAVARAGDLVIITGALPGDEVMGIETLFPPGAASRMPAFLQQVDDVRGKTAAANPWWDLLPALFARFLYYSGLAMVVLTPFLLLVVYSYYGREKSFTVPEYLSFTPHPEMKPWAVNLLFKGDAMTFDQDGYYATLLDLHRRKLITFAGKPDGKGVTITVNQQASPDAYEQRVLDFLKDAGKDGVVDSGELQELATQARTQSSAESRILRYQRELSSVTRRTDPVLIARYIVDGRDHILPLLFVAVAFCIISVMAVIISPVLWPTLVPAVFFWGGMLVQSGAAMAFPSTLFGHWKDDRYKEKLEWDAFARFLSDLALIRQYTPADISMWGEWLVFGTALGVGEKIEHAMQELNIRLPDAGFPVAMGLQSAFIPVLAFTPPSRGGGGGGFGGGGSFGGGGGFGGGGVGGR